MKTPAEIYKSAKLKTRRRLADRLGGSTEADKSRFARDMRDAPRVVRRSPGGAFGYALGKRDARRRGADDGA